VAGGGWVVGLTPKFCIFGILFLTKIETFIFKDVDKNTFFYAKVLNFNINRFEQISVIFFVKSLHFQVGQVGVKANLEKVNNKIFLQGFLIVLQFKKIN
jgi:hypothetical protein